MSMQDHGVMLWPGRVNSVLDCLNRKASSCEEGVLGISFCCCYIVSCIGLI